MDHEKTTGRMTTKDFDKICRCCLSEETNLKDLFSSIENRDESISDVLYYCLSVKVSKNDGFPQNICLSCLKQLQDILSFKFVIVKSKDILVEACENMLDLKYEAKSSDEDLNFLSFSDDSNNLNKNNEEQKDSKFLKKDHAIIFSEEPNPTKSEICLYDSQKLKKKEYSSFSDEFKSSKIFYCSDCPSDFESAGKLYKHCLKNHPVVNSTGRSCDHCRRKFNDFKSLIIHRKTHFTPFVCQICWQGFFSKSELDEHKHTCKEVASVIPEKKRTKTKSVDDLRQCHICGKSYPVGYIKVHMLIHGEKTYECKICSKTFKQPCSLNSHMKWNHKKDRIHQCPFCISAFITSSARSTHVRKVHHKEKNWMCISCNKFFYSNHELKRHLLIHD